MTTDAFMIITAADLYGKPRLTKLSTGIWYCRLEGINDGAAYMAGSPTVAYDGWLRWRIRLDPRPACQYKIGPA